MTKPAITLRSVKGTALSHSELDTNFTNLDNATVSLQAGTAGTVVNSDLNGTITLVAGSNILLGGNDTNKTITITSINPGGTVTGVTGTTGRITSSGGTAPAIDLASGVTTAGTTGSATLIPVITVDTYGRVTSVTTAANPQGTVTSVGGTGTVSGLTLTGTITGTGNLTLGGTLSLATPPAIGGTTPSTGAFTTLTASTSIAGPLKGYNEPVFALTYAATLTPNATNGNVQKVTLTGNLTLSAFTSPVAGQSITMILVQDATGSRILTSTMKFAGGQKTLSTTANSIDVLHIFYDGTNYLASLVKGFA